MPNPSIAIRPRLSATAALTLLLAACHGGDGEVAHGGTAVAGSTGRAVDYRCADGRKLRVIFIGERAIADTGYDRFDLARAGRWQAYRSADGKVEFHPGWRRASLEIEGGRNLEDCAAAD